MKNMESLISKDKPFDYDVMQETLLKLKSKYHFLEVGSIGNSLLGRSIPLVTIGNGTKSALYIGSHHGMEWITSALLVGFINDFCYDFTNGNTISEISCRVLFETRKIYIIPILNPDGVDYAINGLRDDNPLKDRVLKMNGGSSDFSHWQANARGVDLNHNYDSGFWEYKIVERDASLFDGAPTKFSGEHPESEPETHALCNFVRFKKPDIALSLHTQGEEIYYTSGDKSPNCSLSIAKTISRLSGYRISFPTGTAKYGGFTDWFIESFERPSFTLECGKGVNPLPFSNYDEIYYRIKRALFTLPVLI